MIIEKRGSRDGSLSVGSRGRAPVRGFGEKSFPEAKTLLLNEHALFNAPSMKIVKFVAHI